MKKALAATLLAAALSIPALITPASAADVVQEGRTIEAFLGTNLVNVQNYPANKRVTIDVLRNDVLVSSVTGKTDAEGFAEFNHIGGGQVSQGGDCFKPPVSPDVMPGDTIRTKTAGDPAGVRDSAVVRDVSVDFDTIAVDETLGTITVSGHAIGTAEAPIVPGTDILELRLNKGDPTDRWDTGPDLDQDRANRRDLRVDVGENVQPDGTWTRTLRVSQKDARNWNTTPGEVFLEWSVGGGAEEEVAPPAIFVADEAEAEGLPGCPPFAENAITSSTPKVINKANVGRGLILSGISNDASAVSVTLDDRNDATPAISLAATPQAAYVAPHHTWKTDPMTAEQLQQLAALNDGRLTATANVGGEPLNILKDTVAPKTPTATPKPGTYSRTQLVTLDGQAGTKVHYTLNGSRPTAASKVFSKQIRIAKTKTIKAIAVDKAGNASPVKAFRYRIR